MMDRYSNMVSAGAPPSPQSRDIERVLSRLTALAAEAGSLDSLLDDMEARAFGDVATEKGSGSIKPVRSGSFGQLEDVLDLISALLDSSRNRVVHIATAI